jgi:hypothetical protein
VQRIAPGLGFEHLEEGAAMTSQTSRARVFSILAAAVSLFAGMLVFVLATPAQAYDDEHLVKVSYWCGQTVRFTNLTSDDVHISYEISVPLSPFSAKEGEFSLDAHETYWLKAYGGQKGGPVHRLYYKAESGDHDQEGYVDQWKYCKKPLVKTYAKCGHVTFTNVFNHKVKVWYQEGPDYGEWDDKFWLYPTHSKKIEFDSTVLWFSAESRWGYHYRRQIGTVYQPKKCDEYKDEYKKVKKHGDEDDDEWELHNAGDFILKIIPFSGGPLLDKPTFRGLFRR